MHLTVLSRQESQNRHTMVNLVQLLRRRLRLWTLGSICQQCLQGGVSFGFGGQIYKDGRRRLRSGDVSFYPASMSSQHLHPRCRHPLSCREWRPCPRTPRATGEDDASSCTTSASLECTTTRSPPSDSSDGTLCPAENSHPPPCGARRRRTTKHRRSTVNKRRRQACLCAPRDYGETNIVGQISCCVVVVFASDAQLSHVSSELRRDSGWTRLLLLEDGVLSLREILPALVELFQPETGFRKDQIGRNELDAAWTVNLDGQLERRQRCWNGRFEVILKDLQVE